MTGLATRPDAVYKVQTADGAVLCVMTPARRLAEVKSSLVLPTGATVASRAH